LLESYGWQEDSRQQCDVLVPLETPYGETTRARIWRFRSDATKIWLVGSALRASPLDRLSATKLQYPKHRLGPSDFAICLFRRLCTKTQPKCGLGPAGLAFGASQMHQAQIFRPLDVCLAVLDMLRSTPTTLSVKEYRSRSVAVLTPFLWFPSLTYTGHSTNI